MRLCAILVLAAIAAVPAASSATQRVVDVNGSGDFETIWGAVTVSASGDTILVREGVYAGYGNTGIDPQGRNLVFLAEDGARGPVTIDCGGTARAFSFITGEDASSLVRGFIIINGSQDSGGAIKVQHSSPTIADCAFLDCSCDINGGALYFYDSSSSVTDCIFRGNEAGMRGGAVYTYQTSCTFSLCLFDENTIVAPGQPTNTGGALFLSDGSETLSECTIVENDLDQIDIQSTHFVSVSNCVIANGTAGVAVASSLEEAGMVTHCIIFGNAAGDSLQCDHVENIFRDPLFCDDPLDDYTLCDDSFAVWNNNLWGEQIGAYEAGCEACGSPVEGATWGAVKALFR